MVDLLNKTRRENDPPKAEILISKSRLQRLFDEVDEDKGGSLDFEEFLAMMERLEDENLEEALLPATCYLPPATYDLLLTSYYSLLTIHHSLFITHFLLFTTHFSHCSIPTTYHLLLTSHHSLLTTYYLDERVP